MLKNRQVEGFFDHPGDAYREALARFPDRLFSIQLVTSEPLDLGFLSYAGADEVFVDYYLFRVGLFTTEQMTDATGGEASLPFIVDEVDGFSWGRHADFDVILGMDLLGQCDVTLDRTGTCSIAFG